MSKSGVEEEGARQMDLRRRGGRDEVRTNEEDLVGFEGVSGMAWQAIIAE